MFLDQYCEVMEKTLGWNYVVFVKHFLPIGNGDAVAGMGLSNMSFEVGEKVSPSKNS